MQPPRRIRSHHLPASVPIQLDLPGGRSGLVGLEQILGKIDGLAFVRLGKGDVVRHKIVADIVEAYERNEADGHGGERGGEHGGDHGGRSSSPNGERSPR